MFEDKEAFDRWIESECYRYLANRSMPPSDDEFMVLIGFVEYLKGGEQEAI